MSSKSERNAGFSGGESAAGMPSEKRVDLATHSGTPTAGLIAEASSPPGLAPSRPPIRAVPETTIAEKDKARSSPRVDETQSSQLADPDYETSADRPLFAEPAAPRPRAVLQVNTIESTDTAQTRLATPTTCSSPELQHIQIGNTVLPYLEKGTPDKDSSSWALYPGISAPAASLWELAQHMDGHVVIFEAPKIGVPKSHKLPWYAEVTAEATKQVTDNGKVKIVGHSWGGALAQETAHRSDVESMGILASIPLGPHYSWLDVIHAIPSGEMLTASSAIRNPNRLHVDPGVVYGGDIRDNPELTEKYRYLTHRDIDETSHGNQMDALMFGAVPLATKNFFRRVVMGQGPPTLVVIGRRDPVIPHEYSRRQARKLGMAVHSIEDGHLLPLTRAQEVAGVLQEFNSTPLRRQSRDWKSNGNY